MQEHNVKNVSLCIQKQTSLFVCENICVFLLRLLASLQYELINNGLPSGMPGI